MIDRVALAAWIVAASLVASHGARRIREDVAFGMADAAIANPITDSAEGIRTTAATEVALAWLEGANLQSPIGSNDQGASACWAQIYLPNGARTLEGWTAGELRRDPAKCATVAVRLIKASAVASPDCRDCELVVYARGRDTVEGRRLSGVRMRLAHRLLREVQP